MSCRQPRTLPRPGDELPARAGSGADASKRHPRRPGPRGPRTQSVLSAAQGCSCPRVRRPRASPPVLEQAGQASRRWQAPGERRLRRAVARASQAQRAGWQGLPPS
eukprot:1040823-Alexandrium_andersonii.AAC.1